MSSDARVVLTEVILAPSPTPPLLVPLAASLLKAGYVVLIAVPQVKEAEVVERRLSGLQEKTALRVLIYDPEDPSTFPPFHRSLLATLTLRFAAPGPGRASVGAYAAGDPYNPQPTHIPHIHAFVSLYALNPAPPSQPGALPALPTLVAPVQGGKTPALVSLYPAASVLTSAETFASQVLAANHRLLAANLGASSDARVVSVYVGDVALPTLPAIITEGRALSRRELARQRLRDAARTPTATLSLLRDVFSGFVSSIYRSVLYTLGIGSAARDYSAFEARMLRILKARSCATNYVGQRAWLPTTLQVVPARALPRVLALLPPLPAETGPAPPPPPKFTSEERDAGKDKKRSVSVSSRSVSSSSEHDGEDLASSIHTAGTTQSTQSSADGLDGSWVGLEHER